MQLAGKRKNRAPFAPPEIVAEFLGWLDARSLGLAVRVCRE